MIELRKISAGYRGEPVLRDVDLVVLGLRDRCC